jgi:hypothetical protein
VGSVVGVFEVFEDVGGKVVRRRANDASLPVGYVVVGDAAFVRLVELVVYGGEREGWRRMRGEGRQGVLRGVNWIAVLVAVYAVGLVFIGADVSRVGVVLRRAMAVVLRARR